MAIYSMEIQDQMNYFALKICSQMLHCVLYFQERLDEVIMTKAVRQSLEIEPILGCRLILKNNQPFWESRTDLDQQELCEVMETQNVQKDLEHFLVKPVDAEIDSLVQIKIFRNLQTQDCLCIKINHVASDAGGLKNYAELLAKIYTELALGNEPKIYRLEVVERGQNQFMETLEPQLKATFGDRSKNFMQSAVPNWSFPSRGHYITRPGFVFGRMNCKQYYNMKDLAKKKSVTINDMLLTAFCLALKEEAVHPTDRPIIIQVPVDLRRYLCDKKAPVCNLSGAEYVKVIVDDEDDFLDVLHKVREAMKLIKDNSPGLTSAFALNTLSQLEFSQAKAVMQGNMEKMIQYNVAIPLLTNMGIVSDESKKYGYLTAVDGYFVSPVTFSPGLMVGISSFGDTLTLSVGFSEDSIEREAIERLLNRMINEIEQA